MKTLTPHQNKLVANSLIRRTVSWNMRCYRHSLQKVNILQTYAHALVKPNNDLSKSFIIFAQGRTGSTLLGSLLNSNPEIDFGDEILNIDEYRTPYAFPYLYSLGMKKKSKAKSYGYHVKIYQLSKDHKIDPKKYITRAYTDGWKIIHLKRENLLRHALSNIRAEKTSTYFHYNDNPVHDEGSGKLYIEPWDLIWRMRQREVYQAQEDDILSSVRSYNVVYEQNLLEPERQQDVCRNVFAYLGLDTVDIKVSTNLKRINADSLPNLIANYDEVCTFLQGTRFAHFLE